MSRHYYNIELAVPRLLSEEDVQEIEETLRLATDRSARITTEYVDSEG